MVRMIGEVAKAAGLETVAEYVESAAALLLEKYGIDYAQGYHIGRAMPQPLEFQVDGETPRSRTLGVAQMRTSLRFPK